MSKDAAWILLMKERIYVVSSYMGIMEELINEDCNRHVMDLEEIKNVLEQSSWIFLKLEEN